MIMVISYSVYLAVSVALTVWVGRTLHKNGRVFLVDALTGNEKLADSVNHLLLVGFYLINVGFVTMALKFGWQVQDFQGAIEYLSTKVGIVLLVLGVMHFFNLFVLTRVRRRGLRKEAPLPVARVVRRAGWENNDYLRTVAVPIPDENQP